MLSFLLRVITAGTILEHSLIGCSVPQFDPAKATFSHSVDQLIDANHFRKALALLNSNPSNDPHTALLMSRVQLGLGQMGPAMESAEKALAADPKNPAFHVQVAAVAGRMAEHASMFKQLSLAKRVKKELDEALALDARNTDAIYGLILYSDLAPAFMGGDKERALKLAEQLSELAPARGYLAQATLASNRKDPVAEEGLLEKAVAADSRSYDAHLALSIALGKTQPANWERADEQACQALYTDPSRAEAWQILTEAAASGESLLEVDGLLAVYRKFNPEDASPAYRAAVALIATGKHLDLAQQLLQQFLALPPDGNAPSPGLARYQLARIAEKQGHNSEALALLRTAVGEDTTLEDARKELKRLERTNGAEVPRAQ